MARGESLHYGERGLVEHDDPLPPLALRFGSREHHYTGNGIEVPGLDCPNLLRAAASLPKQFEYVTKGIPFGYV
jgi:hypothetical protein